jgi:hypothetical protein
MTSDVRRAEPGDVRLAHRTYRERDGATRRERGAGRTVRQRRCGSRDGLEPFRYVVNGRYGGEKARGVGVMRFSKNRLYRSRFDNMACIEDVNAIGHSCDKAEIMGDENNRDPAFGAQTRENSMI